MKTIRNTFLVLSLLVALMGCQSQHVKTVPDGTSLVVSLEYPLSTEINQTGDVFESQSTEPVMVDGEVVIPAATTFRGTLLNVKKPGSVDDSAEMTLKFEEIVSPDGETYEFSAAPITLVGNSDKDADIERLAGTTVAGAVIGGIAEGGKGAVIGAIVGAGAGGTWAVATKGEHIVLKPGQQFRIETISSTEIPIIES